jgi:hypothetical protein
MSADLDCIDSLDELARLAAGRIDLFVRWSRSPALDQETGLSFDELTASNFPACRPTRSRSRPGGETGR